MDPAAGWLDIQEHSGIQRKYYENIKISLCRGFCVVTMDSYFIVALLRLGVIGPEQQNLEFCCILCHKSDRGDPQNSREEAHM